jgi:pimeloyl-ACP methyl ester carboxylesterase
VSGRELRVGDRVFTVHEDGASDGPVILHHHGTPLADGPFPSWSQDAASRGARLICYDRPGYGGSTAMPERTVADAAVDSALIMDALGVERFATWGISGGGPHALACAALLPDRVFAAASLAGVAPFDAPGLNYFRGMGQDNIVEFGLAMAGRDYIEPFSENAVKQMLQATPAEMVEMISTLVSGPDQAVLDGALGEYWASSMSNTFAQGGKGWVDDDIAFVLPFGFDLASIRVPTLIVHGRQDRFVPLAHGEWLAGAIPRAESWISDEDGHMTLYINRVPAVHEWLVARA